MIIYDHMPVRSYTIWFADSITVRSTNINGLTVLLQVFDWIVCVCAWSELYTGTYSHRNVARWSLLPTFLCAYVMDIWNSHSYVILWNSYWYLLINSGIPIFSCCWWISPNHHHHHHHPRRPLQRVALPSQSRTGRRPKRAGDLTVLSVSRCFV